MLRIYDSKYDMKERVTATIDAEIMGRIRRIVGARGVSKFLEEAARDKLANEDLLTLLDELDAKYGKPTKAQVLRIDREMRKFFYR